MSTVKKILSAGLLGGLYLFDHASVSARPSKDSGSMDIKKFPITSDICPRFPYFDLTPEHEYCPYYKESLSEYKKAPVIPRNLLEASYDFFIGTTKKSYWFVESQFFNKEELLFSAIQDDNNDKTYYLIKNGADFKSKDKNGRILLHYVKNKKIAQWLKDNGVDVNAKDINGCTPLHKASNKDVAQYLIDNGADVHARDDEGRTPLHLVANAEVAQVLIDNLADVNALDNLNQNPLHLAESEELAKFFQEKGAKLFVGNEIDKAFVFHPTYDWNGAFSSDLSRSHVFSIGRAYSIGQKTISEYTQLIETLNNNIPSHSLKVLVISGHGSPESIRFGETNLMNEILSELFYIYRVYLDKTSLTKDNFPLIKEQLRQSFKKALTQNATVILQSCSTAKDKDSIAYEVLKILPIGTKLISPKSKAISYLRINNLKPLDVSFFGTAAKTFENVSFSYHDVEMTLLGVGDITMREKRVQTKKPGCSIL